LRYRTLPQQKKKRLKAKIAVAVHHEWGSVPKAEAIKQGLLLAWVIDKAVFRLPFQWQKQSHQLALF
jgi:hypothetical protein